MDHAVIWGGKGICIKESKYYFSVIEGNTMALCFPGRKLSSFPLNFSVSVKTKK